VGDDGVGFEHVQGSCAAVREEGDVVVNGFRLMHTGRLRVVRVVERQVEH